ERIDYVFRELMPEDLAWYKSLEGKDGRRFLTEEMVSQVHNKGANVILNCMKVGKPFCVEYTNGDETFFYKDCVYIERTYQTDPFRIDVDCNAGRITLLLDHVIRSAYTTEELTVI
ncbi:MAG: hypothetical protein Q4D71_14420, partial [Oscillospiraceae bacterium]|nr:hypothetical protein [Oscillospiraceae bacterium]